MIQGLSQYGIGVATGEQCANRVLFKQFLQSGAIDFCQIDAARVGGVNEILSVILMAKKFNGENTRLKAMCYLDAASCCSTFTAGNHVYLFIYLFIYLYIYLSIY